jgi:hypothetical protein
VQTRACRYGGGAIVTFINDHPQDPNASFGGIVGCSLTSGAPGTYPLTYACKQGGTAVLSTSCTYAGIQNGTCPAHYTFDSVTGTCKWDNNRTASIECATGYFFNPISHCCAVETGKLADSPVCPVGLVFTETGAGQYSCLPGSSAVAMPLVQAAINPPDCPGLCNLSVELCAQRNLVFCANTCACLSVGVKCPTH